MLTFKSTMYLKVAKSIQTYKIQGWTLALQAYSVLEICKCYHTKIPKFKGGRWRYKLTVSMQFAKSAIQRYKISRVDIQGWTLSLQTHGVLEVCKVYNGAMHKFKGGHWRYKLIVSLKLAKSIPYKDSNIQGVILDLQTHSVIQTCKVYYTKIHKFKGGRWRYKLTVWLKFAQPTIHR